MQLSTASGLIIANVVSTIIRGKPSFSMLLLASADGCAPDLALSMSTHTQYQKKTPKNLAQTQTEASELSQLHALVETTGVAVAVARYNIIIQRKQ